MLRSDRSAELIGGTGSGTLDAASNFRSTRRAYGGGDRELDAKVAALVLESGIEADTDLSARLICSFFRLVHQCSDRGELRMVNAAH